MWQKNRWSLLVGPFFHLAAGLSLCQFRGLGRKDIYRRQQQTRKLRLLFPKNVGGFKGPGVLSTIERLR